MLHLVPVTHHEAREFLATRHPDHRVPVMGTRFAFGAADREGRIVGIAIAVRPTGHLDDGRTLHLDCVCTDGTANAAATLQAAMWRVAKVLGYTRLLAAPTGAGPDTSWTVIGQRLLPPVRAASTRRHSAARALDSGRWGTR